MKRDAPRFLCRTALQIVGRVGNDCNSSSSRLLFVRSLSCTTNVALVRHIYHESSQQQRHSSNNSNGHRANGSSSSSSSSNDGLLELTESEFHNLADDTLDELVDWLTVVEESEELDADIVLSVRSFIGCPIFCPIFTLLLCSIIDG